MKCYMCNKDANLIYPKINFETGDVYYVFWCKMCFHIATSEEAKE